MSSLNTPKRIRRISRSRKHSSHRRHSSRSLSPKRSSRSSPKHSLSARLLRKNKGNKAPLTRDAVAKPYFVDKAPICTRPDFDSDDLDSDHDMNMQSIQRRLKFDFDESSDDSAYHSDEPESAFDVSDEVPSDAAPLDISWTSIEGTWTIVPVNETFTVNGKMSFTQSDILNMHIAQLYGLCWLWDIDYDTSAVDPHYVHLSQLCYFHPNNQIQHVPDPNQPMRFYALTNPNVAPKVQWNADEREKLSHMFQYRHASTWESKFIRPSPKEDPSEPIPGTKSYGKYNFAPTPVDFARQGKCFIFASDGEATGYALWQHHHDREYRMVRLDGANSALAFWKCTAIDGPQRWLVIDTDTGKNYGMHSRYPPEPVYVDRLAVPKCDYELIVRRPNPVEPTYKEGTYLAIGLGYTNNDIDLPIDPDDTTTTHDIIASVGLTKIPTQQPAHGALFGFRRKHTVGDTDRTSIAGRYTHRIRSRRPQVAPSDMPPSTLGRRHKPRRRSSRSRSRSRSQSPMYSDDDDDASSASFDPFYYDKHGVTFDNQIHDADRLNRIYRNTKCKVTITGNPDENLFDKIFECELYMHQNDVTEKEMTHYLTTEGLKNPIRKDWLEAMRADSDEESDEPIPDTYDNLLRFLMDQFDGIAYAKREMSAFYNMRQGTQLLHKYYKKYIRAARAFDNIRRIVHRYYPPHKVQQFTEPNNHQRVKFFLKSLQHEDQEWLRTYMAQHAQVWSLSNLKDAIEFADRRLNGVHMGRDTGKDGKNKRKGDDSAALKVIVFGGGGGQSKNKNTAKFKCHYCKKRGHFKRDCPKKKHDDQQNKRHERFQYRRGGRGGRGGGRGGKRGDGFRNKGGFRKRGGNRNNNNSNGGGRRGGGSRGGGRGGGHTKQRNPPNVTCYTCGNKGHYMRDCPDKNRGKRNTDTTAQPSIQYLQAPPMQYTDPMLYPMATTDQQRQLFTMNHRTMHQNIGNRVNMSRGERANTRANVQVNGNAPGRREGLSNRYDRMNNNNNSSILKNPRVRFDPNLQLNTHYSN